MPAPKIITHKNESPGPLHLFDWDAWYEDDPNGPRGFGFTEKEAIDRLKKHFRRED